MAISYKHSLILLMLLFSACVRQPASTPTQPEEYYSADAAMPREAYSEDAAADEPRHPSFPKKAEVLGDVAIGMLIPLTGAQAEMGKQLRDAALLGLYDKQQSLTRMEMTRNPKLIIRDTGSTPEQVKKATQELLDAKVQVILGPLMAEDVRVASELTLKNKIPLISFSNNEEVAKEGVYVFGFNPAEQITRVANFAMKAKIIHFAALAPQSDYGRKVVQQLSTQISGQGLSLQPVEFYDEGFAPSPLVLNRLASQVKEWGDARKAVFLPMNGKPLEQAASTIYQTKNVGIPFLKLLGTGLWDDPQIIKSPLLQGAWFATSSPVNTSKFGEKFRNTYHYEAMRLASLAYDAVALVTTLALENGDAAFTNRNIANAKGFNGPANGTFRLLPSGKVERLLAVVEIGKGSFYIVDPAPTKF